MMGLFDLDVESHRRVWHEPSTAVRAKMTTIFICGDPHGEFDHILDAAVAENPAAVILLGDLDLRSSLDVVFARINEHVPIWWIPGNHDTDDELAYDSLFGSDLAARNLHGRVVDICGVRVAGLGGVFRSKIWSGSDVRYSSQDDYIRKCGKGNLWRKGLPLRHRSSIFPSDVTALNNLHADILVTHEAPGAHPHGNLVLTELALRMQVGAAFHGHHHETIVYGDQVWRGVGLREIYRFHF
jgi:Icc-related predicted phosphoesterase